jgi:hypothetical protein
MADISNGKPDLNTDPFDINTEEMAQKYRPLRAVDTPPKAGLVLKSDAAITFSRVQEGLDKLILRMNEVRGMSTLVREQMTRDLPKDDTRETSIGEDEGVPVFEQLARLTIVLSHHIEATEKNLALALAALK